MSKSRVVAIIQARMGSTRLPGKTLVDICGKPLLERVIERVRASRTPDAILVATTIAPEDGAIRDLAKALRVGVFLGNPLDVLDRYYQAASRAGAQVVVRITADDPFVDPQVLDEVVEFLLARPELEYVSNSLDPTYPEGLGVEVLCFEALERTWREARLPSEREHVTPYIWKNPAVFRVANVSNDRDLSALRWTLDYPADLEFARAVYERLDGLGIFSMNDILALLEREPKLTQINQGIERNAGYKLSLEKDTPHK